MKTARVLLAIFAIAFVIALSTSHASSVGNDPYEPGGWDFGSDGHNVLAIQFQNPVPTARIFDSFSFYSGSLPPGTWTAPFQSHALVFRPTGIPGELQVIFDSGALSFSNNAVNTVAITPLAVQAGDLIGHWGRLVGFDLNTVGEDYWIYDGTEFGTTLPSGTFTVPAPGNGGNGTREYALVFTPEPSTVMLLAVGGLMLWRRKNL